MEENIRNIVLPNGLRVILVPRPHSAAATAMVMFGVGSSYEAADMNGAAHFIEHVLFKGGKRWKTAVERSNILDAIGAVENAYTDNELTNYYVQLEAGHLGLAVEMLADMIRYPLFRPEDIGVERGAILQEARMYADDHPWLVGDLFYGLLYPDHPLGRPIIGTVDTITALDREQLTGFFRRHYAPDRAIAVVVGGFEEAIATQLIENSFGSWSPLGGKAELPESPGLLLTQPQATFFRKDDAEQANVAMGFRAYGHDDPRIPALDVLGNILGGTGSSRLWIEVRENRGLAYSVGCGTREHHGTGFLTVRAGLDKEKLELAMNVITGELAKVKTDGVTEEELARAKTNIRGRLALAMESQNSLGNFLGRAAMLSAHPQTPASYLASIDAVTTEEVLGAARDVIRTNQFRLAVVSPFDDSAPYLKLAERFGD